MTSQQQGAKSSISQRVAPTRQVSAIRSSNRSLEERLVVGLKVVIAVDSVHGNTKQVAEALRDEIDKAGHEVVFINLRKELRVPSDGDLLLIGSPTRIAKMTGRAKRFVRKLDVAAWTGKTIVTFDTHMPLPDDPEEREKALKWVEPGAAGKLLTLATERGLKVHSPPLRCMVSDMKGPLVPGEIEKASEYARRLLLNVTA